MSLISEERQRFHSHGLAGILTVSGGVPSNADAGGTTSKRIANALIEHLPSTAADKLAGQSLGTLFEEAVTDFLRRTFLHLHHIRPGTWSVDQAGGALWRYAQYEHLADFAKLVDELKSPQVKAAMGADYLIKPDVVIFRSPEPDEVLNSPFQLVNDDVANRALIRKRNGETPILHASVSCKWTLRSDRAQNARTEALNIIRNRKGPMPHVVCVTAEPLPSRIASLAQGTGDLDCVYHIALPELQKACEGESDVVQEILTTLVEGRRLKDIADLPLDLAV